MDRPVLPRSISSADLASTDRCITYIQRDLSQNPPRGTVNFFEDSPSFTLTVPNLHKYPKEFREYVFRRLIDYRVKEELEYYKVINWCRKALTFIPLSTIGDGNCLLHAASLGMWGFQDRKFILRQAVHYALLHADGTSLYPRWMNWHRKEMEAIGVRLERDQWKREWYSAVDSISMEKTRQGHLQGLNQFHVFVLANVLRRPIVMYSLPKIHSAVEGVTLQNLNFQGLYLPLLWDPGYCKKVPLPIAFSGGHFTSLVAIESQQQYKNGRLLLPLADYSGKEFPVMFKLPEEIHDIRRAYLDIVTVQGNGYAGTPCAEMFLLEEAAYLKPLLSGFIDKCFDAFRYDESQTHLSQGLPAPSHDSSKVREQEHSEDSRRRLEYLQTRINELQAEHERELNTLQERQQRRVNELQLQHEQQMNTLRERLEQERDELVQQKQEEIQDLRASLDSRPWVLERGEIVMTNEKLGGGAYGEVKVAVFRGSRVAAKCLHHLIISDYNKGVFTREMEISSRIHHPNIVQFVGATRVDNPILLYELMATSLYKRLQNNESLTRPQIIEICCDIASALSYLHLWKPDPIIHRDVSSPNILMEPLANNRWRSKLSDFGSANLQLQVKTVIPGNPAYASPEALIPQHHSPAMDVYSFGVLTTEMILQRPPEMEGTKRERQARTIDWQPMKTIVLNCINYDRFKRPTSLRLLDDLRSLQ